jgi:sigma-54 dependent transcriptional regulator, acetoin dehydrogenase operon transcriptional activator AcoR
MVDTTTMSLRADSLDRRAPARFLVLALEAARPLAPSERVRLPAELREISIGRGAARSVSGHGTRVDIAVPDRAMSRRHAVMIWKRTHWTLRDAGSKNGTCVNGVRVTEVALQGGDLVEAGSTTFVYRECLLDDRSWRELQAEAVQAGPLATLSPTLQAELAILRRVAAGDAPVMLSGESGTGKELVARAVHGHSGRAGDFVAVNCGALAPTLIESELFGHRKGAFSGAVDDRPGLVRAADGGTLFLDEIAELPDSAQVALLRVLQEKQVRAIGATRPDEVDLRVVTATHQDLKARLVGGQFRADLYARLAGFSLALPPLRDRREDLGLIAAALLRRLAGDRAGRVRLAADAVRALFAHDWPLNVRELEQALRVALSVADGDQLALCDLPASVRPAERAGPAIDARYRELVDQLRLHHGNLSAVARAMSTSRAQIRRLTERYGLEPDRFRDDD